MGPPLSLNQASALIGQELGPTIFVSHALSVEPHRDRASPSSSNIFVCEVEADEAGRLFARSVTDPREMDLRDAPLGRSFRFLIQPVTCSRTLRGSPCNFCESISSDAGSSAIFTERPTAATDGSQGSCGSTCSQPANLQGRKAGAYLSTDRVSRCSAWSGAKVELSIRPSWQPQLERGAQTGQHPLVCYRCAKERSMDTAARPSHSYADASQSGAVGTDEQQRVQPARLSQDALVHAGWDSPCEVEGVVAFHRTLSSRTAEAAAVVGLSVSGPEGTWAPPCYLASDPNALARVIEHVSMPVEEGGGAAGNGTLGGSAGVELQHEGGCPSSRTARLTSSEEGTGFAAPCELRTSMGDLSRAHPQAMDRAGDDTSGQGSPDSSRTQSRTDSNDCKKLHAFGGDGVGLCACTAMKPRSEAETATGDGTFVGFDQSAPSFGQAPNLLQPAACIKSPRALFLFFPAHPFTLEAVLRHSPAALRPQFQAQLLAFGLLKAVAAYHERGVPHGALTPASVNLTEKLWVRLTPPPYAAGIAAAGAAGPALGAAPQGIADSSSKPASSLMAAAVDARPHPHDRDGVARGSIQGETRNEDKRLHEKVLHGSASKGMQIEDPLEGRSRTAASADGPLSEAFAETVRKWVDWKVSNFDYLLELNRLAGRRAGDRDHHAAFPWVIDFTQDPRTVTRGIPRTSSANTAGGMQRSTSMSTGETWGLRGAPGAARMSRLGTKPGGAALATESPPLGEDVRVNAVEAAASDLAKHGSAPKVQGVAVAMQAVGERQLPAIGAFRHTSDPQSSGATPAQSGGGPAWRSYMDRTCHASRSKGAGQGQRTAADASMANARDLLRPDASGEGNSAVPPALRSTHDRIGPREDQRREAQELNATGGSGTDGRGPGTGAGVASDEALQNKSGGTRPGITEARPPREQGYPSLADGARRHERQEEVRTFPGPGAEESFTDTRTGSCSLPADEGTTQSSLDVAAPSVLAFKSCSIGRMFGSEIRVQRVSQALDDGINEGQGMATGAESAAPLRVASLQDAAVAVAALGVLDEGLSVRRVEPGAGRASLAHQTAGSALLQEATSIAEVAVGAATLGVLQDNVTVRQVNGAVPRGWADAANLDSYHGLAARALHRCHSENATGPRGPGRGALGQGSGWRDLSRTKWRMAKGDEQLDHSFQSPHMAHHVAEDVLSDVAVCVCSARVLPLWILRRVVRTVFEPNEYPGTMMRMYSWTPDECPPEFYYFEPYFRSLHPTMLDIELPRWAPTVAEFLHAHRQALESEEVSAKLHSWIDLTFGHCLSGEAALQSKNVAPLVPDLAVPRGRGRVQLFMLPHPARKGKPPPPSGLAPSAATHGASPSTPERWPGEFSSIAEGRPGPQQQQQNRAATEQQNSNRALTRKTGSLGSFWGAFSGAQDAAGEGPSEEDVEEEEIMEYAKAKPIPRTLSLSTVSLAQSLLRTLSSFNSFSLPSTPRHVEELDTFCASLAGLSPCYSAPSAQTPSTPAQPPAASFVKSKSSQPQYLVLPQSAQPLASFRCHTCGCLELPSSPIVAPGRGASGKCLFCVGPRGNTALHFPCNSCRLKGASSQVELNGPMAECSRQAPLDPASGAQTPRTDELAVCLPAGLTVPGLGKATGPTEHCAHGDEEGNAGLEIFLLDAFPSPRGGATEHPASALPELMEPEVDRGSATHALGTAPVLSAQPPIVGALFFSAATGTGAPCPRNGLMPHLPERSTACPCFGLNSGTEPLVDGKHEAHSLPGLTQCNELVAACACDCQALTVEESCSFDGWPACREHSSGAGVELTKRTAVASLCMDQPCSASQSQLEPGPPDCTCISNDVFSLGCILAELFLHAPLFQCQSLRVFCAVGTLPPHFKDLPPSLQPTVREMLQLDPNKRPSVQAILASAVFTPSLHQAHAFLSILHTHQSAESALAALAKAEAFAAGTRGMEETACHWCAMQCLELLPRVRLRVPAVRDDATALMSAFLDGRLSHTSVTAAFVPLVSRALDANDPPGLKEILLRGPGIWQRLILALGTPTYMRKIHPALLRAALFPAPLAHGAKCATTAAPCPLAADAVAASVGWLPFAVTATETIAPIMAYLAEGPWNEHHSQQVPQLITNIAAKLGREDAVTYLIPSLRALVDRANDKCITSSDSNDNPLVLKAATQRRRAAEAAMARVRDMVSTNNVDFLRQ